MSQGYIASKQRSQDSIQVHLGCSTGLSWSPGLLPYACSSQLTCSQGPKEVPGSLKENPTSAVIKGPEERCPGSPRAPRLGGKGSWGRGQKGSPARPLGACRCHPPAAVETWLPARGSARPPRPSLPSASENLRVFPLLLTAHLLSLCLSLGLSLCLTHTHTILLYSEDL